MNSNRTVRPCGGRMSYWWMYVTGNSKKSHSCKNLSKKVHKVMLYSNLLIWAGIKSCCWNPIDSPRICAKFLSVVMNMLSEINECMSSGKAITFQNKDSWHVSHEASKYNNSGDFDWMLLPLRPTNESKSPRFSLFSCLSMVYIRKALGT